MIFTLEVESRRYSVYGVLHKNIRVIRNSLNNGIGTQILFYLYDGSTLFNYTLLFQRKLTDTELHYLLANSVNSTITTSIPYKDNIIKLDKVLNDSDYSIIQYGLMRYVITNIEYNPNTLDLYLFDEKIATIKLLSNNMTMYSNKNLLDLAGKSRNSVDKVIQQLFKRIVRLDNNIHELRLDFLERYDIHYEVVLV